MRKLLAVLTVLSATILAGAALAKPLDTGVVIDLLNAGLSEPSIRHYVERNHFTFDLSAEDLQALKQAGASDDLIAFLQDREEDQDRGQGEEEPSYAPDYGASGEVDDGVAYSSPGYAYGFYDFYFPSYSYSAYPYYSYPFYNAYYYPYYYPYPRAYYPRYYSYRSGRGEPGLYPRLMRHRSGTSGVRTASPSGSSSGIRSRSSDTRGRSTGIRAAPSSSRPHFSGSRSSGGGSGSRGHGRGRR